MLSTLHILKEAVFTALELIILVIRATVPKAGLGRCISGEE
jgi:hypothetical protein